MKQNYVICSNSVGTHKMVYYQWGNLDNSQVLICVHGLTRNGRDFDYIAQELASEYCVICPDIVGRGESDRLPDPQDYHIMTYVADIFTLLKELNLSRVDWLGTSLGGLIGMAIASQENSPITRLILNDVGPFVSQLMMQRITGYLRKEKPDFANLAEAEMYIRSNYEAWGNLTDEQWQHLTRHSVKKHEDIQVYKLNFDPQISVPFEQIPIELTPAQEHWSWWTKIHCPILLLYGEKSEILSVNTITKMKEIQPEMDVIGFAGVGHSPALMNQEQIEIVKGWLNNS